MTRFIQCLPFANTPTLRKVYITLLNDVGRHKVIVGCWEFNLNVSLPTQLFKHPVIII